MFQGPSGRCQPAQGLWVNNWSIFDQSPGITGAVTAHKYTEEESPQRSPCPRTDCFKNARRQPAGLRSRINQLLI